MRLTITEIQEQDYGEYKCVAKNPRGETDGNIKIYGKWIGGWEEFQKYVVNPRIALGGTFIHNLSFW